MQLTPRDMNLMASDCEAKIPALFHQTLFSKDLLEIAQLFDEKSFTGKIIRTFDDTQLLNLPQLSWENESIENIHASNMNHSLMWGVDSSERLFFAIKTVELENDQQMGDPRVEVLFQLQQGSDRWISGGGHAHRIPLVSKMMDESELALFQELAQGNTIRLDSICIPSMHIALCDFRVRTRAGLNCS